MSRLDYLPIPDDWQCFITQNPQRNKPTKWVVVAGKIIEDIVTDTPTEMIERTQVKYFHKRREARKYMKRLLDEEKEFPFEYETGVLYPAEHLRQELGAGDSSSRKFNPNSGKPDLIIIDDLMDDKLRMEQVEKYSKAVKQWYFNK